jgi:site-specific DNA-methyltransferase (adenine-specific)
MTTIHSYEANSITVAAGRQRREFDGARIIELAQSIQTLGLLQPITIAPNGELVAGERRLRACKHLAMLGVPVSCGGETFPLGSAPVIMFEQGTELALWEAQLDENIRREDLTWQEKAAAVESLHRLRQAQNPAHTIAATAAEGTDSNSTRVRDQLIVAKHLEDREVAAAPTVKDAMKILRKRDEKARLTRLSENVNVQSLSDLHSLHLGDFRSTAIPSGSVDVVLTDPPYGMGAQGFHDGGGAVEVLHEYEDMNDLDWCQMMEDLYQWSWRVTKLKAHLYVFCDIDKFPQLRAGFAAAGWRVHRTPLVYSKSHASSRRVPWPTMGPRRGYELVLYAVKGDRNVNHIVSDVFSAETDENLGHAAQKPVGAYTDLLRRSVAPGDVVCDPFAGSGPVFPAAHELKCRAIGIEQDPAFHGICLERLAAIKEQK